MMKDQKRWVKIITMKAILKASYLFALFLIFTLSVNAQAKLTVENNSMRTMTVKVMKGSNENGSLHKTISISSFSSETIYFSNNGYYFTKTKAVLNGKDPVYQKGQPFHVTNDDTGYSVMTMTFSIKESAVPQVTGGKQISKQEFDQN